MIISKFEILKENQANLTKFAKENISFSSTSIH